jgi:N-acetylneuraminic acid mutarotase
VAETPSPRRTAALAAVGGRVLIAGGTTGTTAVRTILSFDPATGRVRRIGSLPFPLTHAAGATLNGRLLVIGGRSDSLTGQHHTILAVDPVTGAVRQAGSLPGALSDAGAASLGNRVLVLGGRDTTGRVHADILSVTAR